MRYCLACNSWPFLRRTFNLFAVTDCSFILCYMETSAY
uniref:Uncharacterized protein n=1 Tax=Anguilla anguilla TaxID=7936 RepID=A0A0E9T0M2_ANGAN